MKLSQQSCSGVLTGHPQALPRRMPKSMPTQIRFVEPMYALAVRKLPEGPDWLYEIKFDGYRCLAGKDAGGVRLWSRRGNDFTSQFPAIAKSCEDLPIGTLVDGEIVAIDAEGRLSFNMLQHHRSQASAIRFYVFDVLTFAGRDMLQEKLLKRRDALTDAMRPIRKASSVVDISQTIAAPAADLILAVTELGFEGVIAKRLDSLYESGERSGAWVKYKINKGPRVRHWRLHTGQSVRRRDRRLLPRRQVTLRWKSACRLCAARQARDHGEDGTPEDRSLSVCQSPREEKDSMGADKGGNERLPVVKS